MYNTIQTSNAIGGIVHPMVREMYMKKTIEKNKTRNILVVEPECENVSSYTKEKAHHETFNDFWIELGELQKQAKRECGKIDAIDVRV